MIGKFRFVLMLVFLVVMFGCQDNDAKLKTDDDSVTKDPKNEDEMEEVVFEGLDLNLALELKDNSVNAMISLDNNSEKETPLYYIDGKIVELLLIDESGAVRKKDYIEEEKTKIQSDGTIEWEKKIDVDGMSGKYKIKASLMLENQEGMQYEVEAFTEEEEVELKEKELVYLPKKMKTYIYAGNLSEGDTTKESFVHFQNGYVQSNDSMIGTNVYSVNEDGLFLVYVGNGEFTEENIIDGVNKDNKSMILKFPALKGNSWTTDGYNYEILSHDENVKTAYKDFEDVIVVKSNFGSGIKSYYHKDIGLIKVEANMNGDWKVVKELQNIK